MPINANNKLKQHTKKIVISKSLKWVLTLLITYGPGGIFGKILKIIGSKWLLNRLTKRMIR
ncbi:MAG TPA: hypothetical protein DD649_19810 [Providencia sp.]|nr:hypothetical protein [Providencia sp.]